MSGFGDRARLTSRSPTTGLWRADHSRKSPSARVWSKVDGRGLTHRALLRIIFPLGVADTGREAQLGAAFQSAMDGFKANPCGVPSPPSSFVMLHRSRLL